MSKTLKELVEIAAEAYPDHFLQQQLEASHVNVEAQSLEEVLAAYITKEFRELYDPRSSDQQNVQRIVASLERSAHTLERITEQLYEFAQTTLDTPAQDAGEELLTPLLERLRPATG